MMAVQTAWSYIHIDTEAKGAIFASERLQDSTSIKDSTSQPSICSLASGEDKPTIRVTERH